LPWAPSEPGPCLLPRLGDLDGDGLDVATELQLEQVRFIVTGEVRELLPPKAARIPAGAVLKRFAPSSDIGRGSP
jgi:hypothetical protein